MNGGALYNAMRITRTEAHRISQQAAYDALEKAKDIYMENLEILKGIVTDETYAALEAEKDSKIRLGDLSTDKYVSADKYKDLEKQLGKVNSALTEKTTEYDTLKEKAGDNNFFYVPN